MDQQLKEKLVSKSKWLRFLFMVVFAIVNYVVAQILILVIAAIQFILLLLTNNTNQNLLKFGNSLSAYSYQIMKYLTYNSDDKPFPCAEWPSQKK